MEPEDNQQQGLVLNPPAKVNEPTLTLDSENSVPITPETAQQRAAKATYGLMGIQGAERKYQDMLEGISTGKEGDERQRAAFAIDANAKDNVARKLSQTNLSPIEAQGVLDSLKPTDPETVFEYNYAKRFVETVYNLEDAESGEPNWLKKGEAEFPKIADWDKISSARAVAVREVGLKKYQDIRNAYEDQSYFGRAINFLEESFPGFNEVTLRGRTPNTGLFSGGLRGDNLRAQALDLLNNYGYDPDVFNKALSAAVDPLAKRDPALALDYIKAIIDWSDDDRYLNNLYSAVDIGTTIAGLKGGPALARALLYKQQAKEAMKSVVKASARTADRPIQQVAKAAAGDLGEAAVSAETANAVKGTAEGMDEQSRRLQSILRLDTQYMKDNPTNDGQELANRISETREGFLNKLFTTLGMRAKGERMFGALSTETALRALKEEIKTKYPGLSNQITNISDPYMERLATTYMFDVSFMGPNSELFESPKKALEFAQAAGFQDANWFNAGKGYGFIIKHPLDELSPIARQFRSELKVSQTPLSWRNALLTAIRTPEDTLSQEQNMMRKVTTYAPSILFQLAKERAKPIRAMARKAWPGTKAKQMFKEFEETIDFAKTAWNPELAPEDRAPENIGYFFRSNGELDQHYMQHYGRPANDAEKEAYAAVRDLNDMDWVLRNLRSYTNASRVGAQQFRLRLPLSPVGHDLSDWFNGIIRTEFPAGDEAMLVIRDGQHSVYQAPINVPKGQQTEIKEGLKQGTHRVIEVHAPEQHPLYGFGGKNSKIGPNDWIRWVVVSNDATPEIKDLDMLQIPRRGGGHVDYDFSHSIKQADVRWAGKKGETKAYYHGDKTAFLVPNRAMGEDVTKTLNYARMYLRDGMDTLAEQYFNDHFTGGLEFKDFKKWFKESYVMKNGQKLKVAARHSLDEPFQLVARDKMIIDMDNDLHKRYITKTGKDAFVDGTSRGSLNRAFQVQYSGQRDAWDVFSFEKTGTAQNPTFNFIPAERVSPVETMNRSMANIIHSTWMDDYKIAAIESWVQEAGKLGLLDRTPSEIQSSPYKIFHQTNLTQGYKKGARKEIIAQFEANRLKIRQFVGMQDWTNSMLHSLSQHFADEVYRGKSMSLIPTWLLGQAGNDPVRVLRSITFNAKMGLFSPAQFFVHAATFANVMGIAGPVRATQGALGALFHLMTVFNDSEGFLNLLDSMASKLGIFKPGEWKEAYHMLQSTGFLNEGGEYAMKDTALSTKVIEHGFSKFLDFGQVFFRSGVRSLRAGSWYTAYKELRATKGAAEAFGNREITETLSRADLLSHNMSRASNSMLHTGLLSVPAQFYTYFLRLSEMMLGKRLTKLEKARLFGINAALFGIPTASGLWMYPFGDKIRDTARENGYVIGDNFISTTLMEGVPSMLSQAALGIPLDFGERYGPRGNENLGDIVQGDPSFWKFMGGAAFTTLGNTLANFTNFTKLMYAGMTMDPAHFRPSLDEVMDLASELSGINAAYKSWLAVETGRWYSNRGTYVSDATPLAAWIRGVGGLQDQNIVDLYRMGLTIKNRKALEAEVDKQVQINFDRGFRADKDNNPEQAHSFYNKAFHLFDMMNYPQERRARSINRAYDNNKSLIEQLNFQYHLGPDVPAGDEQSMQDAYRKKLQLGIVK